MSLPCLKGAPIHHPYESDVSTPTSNQRPVPCEWDLQTYRLTAALCANDRHGHQRFGYRHRRPCPKRDLAAGPILVDAMRKETLNEQHKVDVMQSLVAFAGQQWGYDMHNWGPDGRGNGEAIAEFQNYLLEKFEENLDRLDDGKIGSGGD